MGVTRLTVRIYTRVPSRDQDYTENGHSEYELPSLPRVGEWIDVDSMKAALLWYRVEHVVHKPNAEDGVSAHVYVVVESPLDEHGFRKTIVR